MYEDTLRFHAEEYVMHHIAQLELQSYITDVWGGHMIIVLVNIRVASESLT